MRLQPNHEHQLTLLLYYTREYYMFAVGSVAGGTPGTAEDEVDWELVEDVFMLI